MISYLAIVSFSLKVFGPGADETNCLSIRSHDNDVITLHMGSCLSLSLGVHA